MARRRSTSSGARTYWPFLGGAIVLIIAIVVLTRLLHNGESAADAQKAMKIGCTQVTAMFLAHSSGSWVTMAAPVVEFMPDAHGSATHQRFILKCPHETVLIENNVDVGQRVPLTLQETVGVHGQYIWNHLGGLIHYTHHSTNSGEPSGWIYAGGKVYQ